MKKINSSKIEYLSPIKIPDIIKKIKEHKNPLIILRYICYFIPILVSMYFYTALYTIYKTELMQLLLASIGLISPLMALVIAIRPFEEKIKFRLYNRLYYQGKYQPPPDLHVYNLDLLVFYFLSIFLLILLNSSKFTIPH